MALEVCGVKKIYGDFSLSLDFSVEDGETLVLAGPSGCGKTTALHLIAGLTAPDEGSILIDRQPLDDLPPWKRNISVVFQDLALFPHLNVGKNIAYGPFIRGVRREKRREIVEEMLRTVRLPGYEKRRVSTLSGGEQQRVAIGRALAADPRALLLDEPFSSLDAPLRRSLRRAFLEIRQGSRAPCVFVTHDREEAAVLGDRIALLSAGRIIETGPARSLFLKPRTAFGGRFFGSGQALPCILRSRDGGSAYIDTPLGPLIVPPSEESPEKDDLVFIPTGALDLCAGPLASGQRSCSAIFKRELFQGDRMIWELELPLGEKFGLSADFSFTLEADTRSGVPPKGSVVRFSVDESRLSFVKGP